MDKIYSTDFLKNLYTNFLIHNNIDQVDLIQQFKFLCDQDCFDNYENNFLLLLIIEEILLGQEYLPLLKLLAKNIKIKIIFYYQSHNTEEIKTSSNATTINKNNCCKNINLKNEELNLLFWNYYKENPFHPKANDQYKLPPKGETMILGTYNNTLIPGKNYFMKFKINHLGEILDWAQYPQDTVSKKDFDAIYQGLLGQIMEYQKEIQ